MFKATIWNLFHIHIVNALLLMVGIEFVVRIRSLTFLNCAHGYKPRHACTVYEQRFSGCEERASTSCPRQNIRGPRHEWKQVWTELSETCTLLSCWQTNRLPHKQLLWFEGDIKLMLFNITGWFCVMDGVAFAEHKIPTCYSHSVHGLSNRVCAQCAELREQVSLTFQLVCSKAAALRSRKLWSDELQLASTWSWHQDHSDATH